MKKLYTLSILQFVFLACCLLPTANSFAQAPAYLWAKRAGGTDDDRGLSCSTDANGNVIATGWFWSPSITFGTTTLTNADTTGNTPDMFILKYAPNGNVLWAKSAGGTYDDYSKSCSTDDSSNIIATGFFYSPSITFGTTTLTNVDTTGSFSDMFIVKYDQNGNVLWAQHAGGTSWDDGNSCSTDASGNIIATGLFYSPSITFGTTTLTNAGSGYFDVFIVKYNSNGNVLWAKSAGGTFVDDGNSCSTDANGNIIATGYFTSPSIAFGTTTLTNADTINYTSEMFIVKYAPNGNVLWAKSAGGNSDDKGYSCSTDVSGNMSVTGYFASASITFGTTTLTNDSSGTADMFIVKYDQNGNVLWAKSAGGAVNDYGNSCTTDASGNIIATGYFKSSSITFGTTTLTNASSTGNYSDMFIVKYDSNGNVLWAKSVGGISNDYGNSCSTDPNGDIISTGYFASSSITFGSTTLTNAGGYDMFIVKLNGVTGIESPPEADENSFSVFPNPNDGKFVVQITNQYRFADYELKIYNLLGELIYRSPNTEYRIPNTIDISNKSSGIYFMRVITNSESINKKIIIR